MAGRISPATAVGWVFVALVLGVLAWRASTDSVDFPIYHHAGRQILNGDFELYPLELYEGRSVGGHGFRYAPAVAFLFVPLALLPLQAAACVFFALKVAAFVHMFAILSRRLGLAGRQRRLMVMVVLVTGGYLLEEFRGGNLQLFVVYLCVLGFYQALRDRALLPGVAIGVAIAAKITPLMFLAYFVLQRKFRAVAITLGVLVFLAVGPILVWGSGWNTHLLDGFARYSGTSMSSPPTARDYSLRGALRKYRPFAISDDTASHIWMGVLALTGVATLVVIRRSGPLPIAADLHLAILLTCLPLLSPHAQRIYFVTLCVPVAVIYSLVRGPLLSRRLRLLAIASLIVTSAASTILPAVLGSRRLSLAYLELSPYTFATLFLLVTLFAIAFHVSSAMARDQTVPPPRPA